MGTVMAKLLVRISCSRKEEAEEHRKEGSRRRKELKIKSCNF
jgi:hypothetical protein